MDVERRIALLKKLGQFILSDDIQWVAAKEKASYENAWFIPEFVSFQLEHVGKEYLDEENLRRWISGYTPSTSNKTIGIIMAGNIPLAGIHDFISAFIAGHNILVKPSSKDFILIKTIIDKLKEWEPSLNIHIAQQLKNCDAYIATGSNNSARYFDYYFSKYPHIIRRNRTSAAILTGKETTEELDALADDVYLYFGLGCRNITKLYVPENYDFIPLLDAFKKYNWLFDNHKYKNNYDYQLAIMIINNIYYMTNGSILLQQNNALFTAISIVNYEFYKDAGEVRSFLENNQDIQCIVGQDFLPFGQAQVPALDDYADKADTLRFLLKL
ncbi:MAG: acyl-CoA reductase [Chitinophagaceae bacterium]|nr:acyl-CoA reductase [Chitinophagaceae bacterium]